MSKIIILNGAARKSGGTSALITAFSEGAKSTGHEVKEFYLQMMTIRGCIGCMGCSRNADPCSQKDEMSQIYDAFLEADVVILASPIYFLTVTGPLITTVDRLFAVFQKYGSERTVKDSAIFLTSADPEYDLAVSWYRGFTESVGWNNLGEILGSGNTEAARELGASIQ